MPPPKKPRLSLTKAQTREGAGAELLTLCQTVTADGVLTDEEVREIRRWLAANRDHDLPAIDFLIGTVERVLADGKVTREERKELYAAIEKVLPPEARRDAAGQRKAVEVAERERARQGREAEREQARAERERSRPIYSVNFMVAGVHYEGRPAVIRRHVQEGDRVFLARDPANRFSRNAVEVRSEGGYQIGFVPEDYAPEVAPLLDDGNPHAATVTKVLRNARVPIPVVQVYLYRADAGVEEMVFPHAVPHKREYVSERRPSEWEELDEDPIIERRHVRARAAGRGCAVLLPLVCVPAVLAIARAVVVLG